MCDDFSRVGVLILQQVHRVDVTPQGGLVLELRQTLLALIREILGMDLDVFGPLGLLEEAFGTDPAAVLGEGVASSVADVTRKRWRMLELFQTVGTLMLPVVLLAGMLGQAGWGFEGFWTVATLVLAGTARVRRQAEDDRRNETGSFGRGYG